jgi:hypothetical protein
MACGAAAQVLPTSPRTTGSNFFSPGRGGASPDGSSSPGSGSNWWQGGGPLRNTGARSLGRPGRGSTPTPTPQAAGTPGSLPGLGGRGPSFNPGTTTPRAPGAVTTPGATPPGSRGPGSLNPGQRPGSGGSGPRWGSFVPANPTGTNRGIGSTTSTGRPSWQITPPRGSTTYTAPPAISNPIRGSTPGRSFTPAPAATSPGRTSNPFTPALARVRRRFVVHNIAVFGTCRNILAVINTWLDQA